MILCPAHPLKQTPPPPPGRKREADDLVLPGATREFDHVFSRRGNIIVINRSSDENAIGGFNFGANFLRTWHTVTLVRVTERQISFADVDPIAIDFFLLQMRKRCLAHSAAVAFRVAAGADDKMLRHKAIVEANTERSTSNA